MLEPRVRMGTNRTFVSTEYCGAAAKGSTMFQIESEAKMIVFFKTSAPAKNG